MPRHTSSPFGPGAGSIQSMSTAPCAFGSNIRSATSPSCATSSSHPSCCRKNLLAAFATCRSSSTSRTLTACPPRAPRQTPPPLARGTQSCTDSTSRSSRGNHEKKSEARRSTRPAVPRVDRRVGPRGIPRRIDHGQS
jgi:hypothetical protein